MSNRRAIVFLLLAIVLLAFANFLVGNSHERVRQMVHRTLVDELNDISRIVIKHRDGKSISLEKEGEWKIIEPYCGRADEQSVVQLLDSLLFSPIVDTLEDSDLVKLGHSRADFSLSDPILNVTVSDGLKSAVVRFGRPLPMGDNVYATVDGRDAIFTVPLEVLAMADRPAEEFRCRSVLQIEMDSISAFDIRLGTRETLSFSRNGAWWKVGEKRASEPKIRKFLADLAQATAIDFIWPSGETNEVRQVSASLLATYDFESEDAVSVTLKDVNGKDQRVLFGKVTDNNQVYALIQNGNTIVTLPSCLKESIVQGASAFTDLRLFPVDPKSVTSFSVVDGGISCVLARENNAIWHLESPVMALAEKSTVEAVLDHILSLSSADVLPNRENGVAVSIQTNLETVIVSREAVLGKARIEDFRSLEVLRIDPSIVKRIVRTTGGRQPKSSAVVYGRDRHAWNVETAEDGAAVDEKGIASVLSALNPLSALQVVKLKVVAGDMDDYGLDNPYLTLAIDQDRADSVRRNILIGASTEKGRFATVGSSDAVFEISEEVLRKLTATIVEK